MFIISLLLICLLGILNCVLCFYLANVRREMKRCQTFENRIFHILSEISEQYKSDGTTPGLVLSYLPDSNLYYASIIRYLYPKGEGKRVVCSTKSNKENVIYDVYYNYLENKHEDVEVRHNQYLNWKNSGE